MRAEQCVRVGRDYAALRGVLGVHVVDFTWFLPNRETSRLRLERTICVRTRQRGVLARSSGARDIATVLGYHPQCLGAHLAEPHTLPARASRTGPLLLRSVFTQNMPTPRARYGASGRAPETTPAPEIDTAAPGIHMPRPLHTRADALTRQLPRAAAQQLSEQSNGRLVGRTPR